MAQHENLEALEPAIETQSSTVCVTGAAGFVGSHLVEQLLARGYTVRATVRDAANTHKLAHLLQFPGARERLGIHGANLFDRGSFDAAIAGCDTVFHVAAATLFSAKDPEREIIAPSLEGTRNVLDAVRKAPSVGRLVFVSSVSAIDDGSADRTFTETDFNDTATSVTDPYGLAKLSAERLVHAFEQERKRTAPEFRAVAVNPGYALGPVHTREHMSSTTALVDDLIRGTFPACPRLRLSFVDVRDIARALILAAEIPSPAPRNIVVAEALWLAELGARLQRLFPEYRITTGTLPNALVYVASLFDRRLSRATLRRHLGRRVDFDAQPSLSRLGLTLRPLDATLVDTARSMIDPGFVQPRRARRAAGAVPTPLNSVPNRDTADR